MFNFYHHVQQWTPRMNYGSGLTLSDRLASQVTVSLLVLFGLLSILDHYFTRPDLIQCKCPRDLQSCDKDFVNSACWVQNEFYVPQEVKMDKNGTETEKLQMDTAYYQWIGLLLIGQGILGYLPRAIWLCLSEKSGFPEDRYLHEARKMQTERDPDYYERELRSLVRNIEILIIASRHRHTFLKRLTFLNGLGLTLRFLFCKLLYVITMVLQIVLVVKFGGASFGLLNRITKGATGNPTTKLPSILKCRLKMDTDPEVSYLCALPGNLLHQIVFGFLFYWMVFVSTCNILSLMSWIFKCALRSQRIRLIRSTLSQMDSVNYSASEEKTLFYRFVLQYLKVDGVLIVRLIEYCTDYFTMCRVVKELWERYKHQHFVRLEPTVDDLDI